MKKSHLLIACSIAVLSACGKSPVDMVKNDYVDGARTTTVANALTNRALCKSEKWESFKDEKGRETVQYSCMIVDGKDFNGKRRENYIASAIKDRDARLENTTKELEQYRAEMAINPPGPDMRAMRLEKMGYIENRLKYIKEKERDEDITRTALGKFVIYEDVTEIFQWIVNKDGEPTLVFGDIEARRQEGKIDRLVKYNRPIDILKRIPQSKAKGTQDYINEIGTYTFTDWLLK